MNRFHTRTVSDSGNTERVLEWRLSKISVYSHVLAHHPYRRIDSASWELDIRLCAQETLGLHIPIDNLSPSFSN
jgi:hypothetical protein